MGRRHRLRCGLRGRPGRASGGRDRERDRRRVHRDVRHHDARDHEQVLERAGEARGRGYGEAGDEEAVDREVWRRGKGEAGVESGGSHREEARRKGGGEGWVGH